LLERGQSLVEEELIYLTEETTSNNGCGKSQQQQQLAAFSAHLTTEIVHLKESMQSLKVCKACYYLRVNFEKLILEVG